MADGGGDHDEIEFVESKWFGREFDLPVFEHRNGSADAVKQMRANRACHGMAGLLVGR